jgi:hypothetical protein
MTPKIKKIKIEMPVDDVSFRDLREHERRIFLAYVSEHILYDKSKFQQLVELLSQWQLDQPVSTIDYELTTILTTTH